MKTGSLYRLNRYHFFFPSKEVIRACYRFDSDSEFEVFIENQKNISSYGPEDIFVLLKQDFLEEAGSIYNVLFSTGEVGWIISIENDFVEVLP